MRVLPSGLKLPDGVLRKHILNSIAEFKPYAKSLGLHTQKKATGSCYWATDEFLVVLGKRVQERHLKIEVYYFHREKERKAYPFRMDLHLERRSGMSHYHGDHHATRVGNLIIDWTARQFDPAAGFPALWVDNGKPRQEPRGKITNEWRKLMEL